MFGTAGISLVRKRLMVSVDVPPISSLNEGPKTKDGLIMGIQHKKFNIHGVQFHPESIKTKLGIKILKNFIDFKVS